MTQNWQTKCLAICVAFAIPNDQSPRKNTQFIVGPINELLACIHMHVNNLLSVEDIHIARLHGILHIMPAYILFCGRVIRRIKAPHLGISGSHA